VSRPLLILAMLAASSILAFAKSPTSKITIEGGHLKAAIAITDPAVLRQFRIWAGPNPAMPAVPTEPQSLIIDWSRGTIRPPRQNLPTYKISFYVNSRAQDETEEHACVVEVVLYQVNPSTGDGYVYLPKANEGYPSPMLHGVEGNWFHAWSKWQELADPLIRSRAKAEAPAK
jgi:hypothetical protein